MSSLVFLCDPDMISSYHNISLVQSSCLDAYSSSAPTKTLMTFLTTIVFNNVDTLDMETIESQMVAIIGMEMSLSGVPVDDITINNVVDGNAALERRYLGTTEDVTNVTYKFSIVLETLGYDQSSGSSAYTQITNEIDSAVADGNLQRNLIAAGETAGIVTFSGLTITTQPQYTTAVFDSLETAMPTPSPTTVDHSNGNSGRSNVPATVFYALGSVVALALVGLGILMVMKRNHKSETFGSNIEIETRNTLTEKYLRY